MNEQLDVEKITEYIKENGLTKKEFCKQCNISPSALYRITHGKNFNLISLFRIAKRMNVPIHQFFKKVPLQ